MATQMIRPAFAGALLSCAAVGASAGTTTINFNNVSHGTVVNNQYAGVAISADNATNNVDVAVAFDTQLQPSFDPDMTSPWSGGNIQSALLGNVLVIQEEGPIVGGMVGPGGNPHNEGARPAGTITFEFNQVITAFGMDVVDIEGPVEFGTTSGFFLQFFLNGVEVADVAFGELVTPGNTFYDASIAFGNNTANRINPYSVDDLNAHGFNVTGFDTVVVNLGGSGGIDNIVYETENGTGVPSPSAAVAGLALFGLTLRRKRQA